MLNSSLSDLLTYETVTLAENVSIVAGSSVSYVAPTKSGYELIIAIPLCWDSKVVSTNYTKERLAFINIVNYRVTVNCYARCLYKKI